MDNISYLIQLIAFAIISSLTNYLVSFFKEKGKNLATKEDIKDITDRIESVKDSYSKSLERHKMELQKEFESSKPVLTLCNKLDETLIALVVKCQQHIDNEYIEGDYEDSIYSAYKLGRFFLAYRCRYEENVTLKKMIPLSLELACLFETGEWSNFKKEKRHKYMENLEETFKFFLKDILPKFRPQE